MNKPPKLFVVCGVLTWLAIIELGNCVPKSVDPTTCVAATGEVWYCLAWESTVPLLGQLNGMICERSAGAAEAALAELQSLAPMARITTRKVTLK